MNLFEFLYSEHVISNVAYTLGHFCWQATIIGLLLKLILNFTSKHALYFRYYSCLGALIFCLIAPIYTFTHYSNADSFKQSDLYTLQPTNLLNHQDISDSNGFISIAKDPNQSHLSYMSVDRDSSQDDWTIDKTNTSFYEQISNHQILVLIWGIGVCFMLFKFIFDLHKTFLLTKRGILPVDSELNIAFVNLCAQLNIDKPVKIFRSSLVNVPVVIGWLKPTILLPLAITVGLDKKQLELIIAHELAHVKREDFLINLIQGVMQVLFFFHPAIYWINRALREEREYICDAIAIQNAPKDSQNKRPHIELLKLDLAKALLRIEELKEGNLSLVAVAATDGHLKRRVDRILTQHKRQLISLESLCVAFLAIIVSFTSLAFTSNTFTAETFASETFTEQTFAKENLTNRNFLSENLHMGTFSDFPIVERLESKRSVINTSTINTSTINVPTVNTTSDNTRAETVGGVNSSIIDGTSQSGKVITRQNDDNPLVLASASQHPVLALPTIVPKQSAKVDPKPMHIAKPQQINRQAKIALNLAHQTDFSSVTVPVGTTGAKTSLQAVQADLLRLNTKLASRQTSVQYKEPKAIYTPYPGYPAEAYTSQLSGKIKVDFTIDARGRVTDLNFSDGASWLFVREIKDKLKQWRYKPAIKDGRLTAYHSSIYFDFELPPEQPLVKYQVGTRIRRKLN
ncbi:M56 family metallopeptidase [Aliikangiella maris]|uniref:Protein TonB n=2 Tax=Aliikangiella maris TaxID=3162458 RepID=A0ABV3MIC7_9GAMM